MADVQVQQMQDEKIAMKKAKGKKSSGESYEFPAVEAHLVHAEIKTPQFDPVTGQDKGIAFIQKFYPEEFKRTEKSNGFAGRKVTILHDGDSKAELEDVEPTEYLDPKIVSEPGAGTPLDIDVLESNEEDIDWLYETMHNGDKKLMTAKTKEEKLNEIKARHGFLRDPRVQEEFRIRARNIIEGSAGLNAEQPNVGTPGTTTGNLGSTGNVTTVEPKNNDKK
jgi:hypothetical protein